MQTHHYLPFNELSNRQRKLVTDALDKHGVIRSFMLPRHAVLTVDGRAALNEAIIQGNAFPSLVRLERAANLNAKLESLAANASPKLELPRDHWVNRKNARSADETYKWSRPPISRGNYKNVCYSNTRRR